MDIFNHIKRFDSFSNIYIDFRIILIILVSVASVKKYFLKLKLINSYLRPIMSQKRLNRLVILSIEKKY